MIKITQRKCPKTSGSVYTNRRTGTTHRNNTAIDKKTQSNRIRYNWHLMKEKYNLKTRVIQMSIASYLFLLNEANIIKMSLGINRFFIFILSYNINFYIVSLHLVLNQMAIYAILLLQYLPMTLINAKHTECECGTQGTI